MCSRSRLVNDCATICSGGSNTFAWRTRRASSLTWTNGFGTDFEPSTSNSGDVERPPIANCGPGDSPSTQRQRWPATVAAGGRTRQCSSTWHSPSATSTVSVCGGWPRDLNSTNRPVRTRMPGGVAGVPRHFLGPLCRFPSSHACEAGSRPRERKRSLGMIKPSTQVCPGRSGHSGP